MKHPVLVILLALSLLALDTRLSLAIQSGTGNFPQSSSTMNPQAEKIRKRVEKLGLGKDVTVNLGDGSELYGAIKNIEADSFMIFEVDIKQLLTIKYNEVKKVRKGYADRDPFTGRRVRSSRLGIILATAAIAIPVIILATSLSREK